MKKVKTMDFLKKKKIAINGQSGKAFLLMSIFVCLCPGAKIYTAIKALKYIPGPGVR